MPVETTWTVSDFTTDNAERATPQAVIDAA
jgi:hypothetical protein